MEKVELYTFPVANSVIRCSQGSADVNGKTGRRASSTASTVGLAGSRLRKCASSQAAKMKRQKVVAHDDNWVATTKKLAETLKGSSLMMVEDGYNWKVVDMKA